MKLEGTIKAKIKSIMERYPATRSSDIDLYKQYLFEEGKATLTAIGLLTEIQHGNVANIESVGRLRRMVQRDHPELGGKRAQGQSVGEE